MPTVDKERYWSEHFENWEQSGLSQRAYCQRHRISLATFTVWRRRLAESARKPCVDIVPIAMPRPPRPMVAGQLAPLTVVLDGGRYRIEVRDGAEADTLRVVLDVLETRG